MTEIEANGNEIVIRVIEYEAEMTFDDYFKFVDVFEMQDLKANDYCPTIEECRDILFPEIEKYAPFLLWISETGYTTEENAVDRAYFQRNLNLHLKLID